MNRDASLYIKDILGNMETAQTFIKGMSYQEFSKDTKTCYAVTRCIEIIGEAAKNVPAAVRKRYPDVPWKQMAGMRDKVIHFYFGVNFERVWLVIKKDIPKLQPLLKKILEDLHE
jgi:uncharacterized protein with HEPN domain